MRGRSEATWEWAMKLQEVILGAMVKRIMRWQVAEILGMTDRSLRSSLQFHCAESRVVKKS